MIQKRACWPNEGMMRNYLHDGLCVLLSTALALLPLPGLAETAALWQVPAPDQTPQALPPRIDPKGLPDFNAAALRAIDILDAYTLSEPPLEDRVLTLNLDAKAAFALVRDTLQSQPYGGHLRDPSQVFWAGGGNAYDKAATLAELLGKMGYDTRLVTGTAPSPAPDVACAGAFDASAWRLTGLGPSVLARIRVRAEASYAALHPLLTPVDAAASDPVPHIWLQMRDGADWVDLDPWLPGTVWGAHPGGPSAPLTETPQPQAVTLTLTVEKLADGQLQREDILSSRLEMPDANGALVALIFGPKVKGVGGSVAKVLAELQGGTGEMVATLLINDREETSAPFAAPGTGSNGVGFLAEAGTQVTTGLWLTLTSTAPGAADHSEVRTIIDLVPAALRMTEGAVVDPAALLPAATGAHLPLALEGLRQIFLSNGGTSHREIAGRKALQMDSAVDLLIRAQSDSPDPWDTIWTSYLEAGRLAMAAETLMRAKPGHNGACLQTARPRALIWGMTPVADDGMLRWLDWTLDDVAVQGGDAAAQAEQMLWHGAVQAAVEKEALMYVSQGPADQFALDTGPMTALGPNGLSVEAAQDQARGYLTVVGAAMPPGMWWRLDPATGKTDARLADLGNGAGYIRPGAGALRGGAATVTDISRSVAQMERDAALRSRIGPDAFRRAMAARRQAQAAEAALERQRAAANEYLMLAKIVIGFALALGSAVLLHNAVALMTADEVVGGGP
jgi:hypothetical protein